MGNPLGVVADQWLERCAGIQRSLDWLLFFGISLIREEE